MTVTHTSLLMRIAHLTVPFDYHAALPQRKTKLHGACWVRVCWILHVWLLHCFMCKAIQQDTACISMQCVWHLMFVSGQGSIQQHLRQHALLLLVQIMRLYVQCHEGESMHGSSAQQDTSPQSPSERVQLSGVAMAVMPKVCIEQYCYY